MNGVEKDKKGKSFVTLTFKKGVSTYGIDEVEEIYDTGGSMMTHGGNTKTGYINDRDSMYHGKNCFVCSHNGPEMMVEIMLKGKMKKIPLNAEKFEPIKTYEEGGAVKIVNKNIKFDKARYKGIFGDFDKDGVVNIDDAYPTNKKKKNTVEPVELAPIIEKLITLKNKLDNSMYKAVDELKEKSPKTANIYARTKTPYSIIKKLIDKRLLDEKKGLTDLIGTTIAVDSYQELIDLKKKIESGLLGTVVSVDDFYSNPNAGYMAYHYIIKTDEGYMVEVQLKTKRMKALNEISHEFYKKGNLDGDNFLEITKLTHYADMGDEEYIKKYDYLMKRKSLLRMLLTGEKKINLKSEKLIG
jgi:ppGpp synthetase/RelA/SpoT-type nucleotidyltranferase